MKGLRLPKLPKKLSLSGSGTCLGGNGFLGAAIHKVFGTGSGFHMAGGGGGCTAVRVSFRFYKGFLVVLTKF